jgi:hypothetical protein
MAVYLSKMRSLSITDSHDVLNMPLLFHRSVKIKITCLGIVFDQDLQIGCSLRPVLMECDYLFFACPSHAIRDTCKQVRLNINRDDFWNLKGGTSPFVRDWSQIVICLLMKSSKKNLVKNGFRIFNWTKPCPRCCSQVNPLQWFLRWIVKRMN